MLSHVGITTYSPTTLEAAMKVGFFDLEEPFIVHATSFMSAVQSSQPEVKQLFEWPWRGLYNTFHAAESVSFFHVWKNLFCTPCKVLVSFDVFF